MPLQRTSFKRKARKKRPWHDKAALDACRGQECFLAIPDVCCYNPDTVVPAHSNYSEHGKGGGRKADDKYTVPACWTCHSWLDQGKADYDTKKSAFMSAYERWEAYRETY